MAEYRLDWLKWFLRVIAWEGLLPLFILLVPIAIDVLKLNVQAVTVTAVAVLVVALLTRTMVGMSYIGSNLCGRGMKGVQVVALFIGIIWLMPLDLAMILCPVNQQFQTIDDVVLFVLAYSGYLMMMVIAMYPGRYLVSSMEESQETTY